MSPDADQEGLEFSRRIRDELERIRESETRVEEALEAVRQARRRVELIARELGREEQRVRALVREELSAAGMARGAEPVRREVAQPDAIDTADRSSPNGEAAAPAVQDPPSLRAWRSDPGTGWAARQGDIARRPALDPSSGAPPSPRDVLPPPAMPVTNAPVPPAKPAVASTVDAETSVPVAKAKRKPRWGERPARVAAIIAAAVLAIAAIGWFTMRGFQKDTPSTTVASTESPQAPAPVDPQPVATPDAAAHVDVLAAAATADPAARVAIYDSLWAARSNLFDTLLATVDSETSERTVKRAIAAWKDGSADAQESDLIHSAFVQHVLKEVDPRIELDGQLLRNPCRGRSCTALLTAWKSDAAKYGLQAPPSDASTNTTALRQVEVALVLGWLRELHEAPQTAAALDTAPAPPTP